MEFLSIEYCDLGREATVVLLDFWRIVIQRTLCLSESTRIFTFSGFEVGSVPAAIRLVTNIMLRNDLMTFLAILETASASLTYSLNREFAATASSCMMHLLRQLSGFLGTGPEERCQRFPILLVRFRMDGSMIVFYFSTILVITVH